MADPRDDLDNGALWAPRQARERAMRHCTCWDTSDDSACSAHGRPWAQLRRWLRIRTDRLLGREEQF